MPSPNASVAVEPADGAVRPQPPAAQAPHGPPVQTQLPPEPPEKISVFRPLIEVQAKQVPLEMPAGENCHRWATGLPLQTVCGGVQSHLQVPSFFRRSNSALIAATWPATFSAAAAPSWPANSPSA